LDPRGPPLRDHMYTRSGNHSRIVGIAGILRESWESRESLGNRWNHSGIAGITRESQESPRNRENHLGISWESWESWESKSPKSKVNHIKKIASSTAQVHRTHLPMPVPDILSPFLPHHSVLVSRTFTKCYGSFGSVRSEPGHGIPLPLHFPSSEFDARERA